MFKILKKTFDTGLVTIGYPDGPAQLSENFRGAPRIDFANWRVNNTSALLAFFNLKNKSVLRAQPLRHRLINRLFTVEECCF